ncbi:HAD-IIB family hydrolase [Lactococcus allomyrinae]|uniref:HAD-IIB family hydrolase n=1 Tax=Lactococcus allomyrinae TaxID=2419773 RepID=A0A387BDB9_9LACT|nr:HAD-IIB family hydrolase [Lactococcus allomyrinae]AYG00042.1 HAD-IIB family hydrolase [Lactococcus allomyrinae]
MIFVFDLDGTICFDGVKISDDILSALTTLEKRGHPLVFASARPVRDMLSLLEMFPSQFLIGGNGSIVRNFGQIEVVQEISDSDFEYLKRLIKSNDLDYLVDGQWNYSLKNRNDEKTNINCKVDANHLAKNVSMNELTNIIKCSLLNLSVLTEIEGGLSDLTVEIKRDDETQSLDLTAKNVNKYTTFRNYFPQEPYVAIGNDENDIELLRNAKISVAVGNHSELDFADFHMTEKNIAQFLLNFRAFKVSEKS